MTKKKLKQLTKALEDAWAILERRKIDGVISYYEVDKYLPSITKAVKMARRIK